MATILEFLPLLSLDFRRLSLAEFDAVIDAHGGDLPGVLDAAYFDGQPGRVVASASEEIGGKLGERLLPIADTLVATATDRSTDAVQALGTLVRFGTAIQIVSELFPADDVAASLEAAVNQIAFRIGLQAKASTFRATMQ